MNEYKIEYNGNTHCNRCKRILGPDALHQDTFHFCDICKPFAIDWTLKGLRMFYDNIAAEVAAQQDDCNCG